MQPDEDTGSMRMLGEQPGDSSEPGRPSPCGDLYASAAALGPAPVWLLWRVLEMPAPIARAVVAGAARVGGRLLGLSVPAPRGGTGRVSG